MNKIILIFSFLLISNTIFSQNDKLIIGRTTGNLFIKKNMGLRVFGFSNSLSGQILLPGPCIDVVVNDSINIDLWNISQGNPVSLTCNNITFLQYNENKEQLPNQEVIDHMEHGFYSFTAKKPGTYFYYSPENYPFNIQAGMFGTIIIRDKKSDYLNKKTNNEVLWCSNEIDTEWHTDAIMNVEHNEINEQIILPDYLPNYFLINGKRAKKLKGLQPLKNRKNNTTLLVRLVNAGLYHHEIEFPLKMNPQLIFGKSANLIKSIKYFKVMLNKGECVELSVSLKDMDKRDHIVYRYIDPINKEVKHKANINVFY
ncbi:multicopper oxidase domain-containing protein [Tenacibaculum sp. Bg11-29]|uniref:multicopper oxidase domain-containing protein n=1 Tax=Tenacibaculum sp. Bg11-29 TaxID=2058306 RepID=UPI001E41163E|nr:multicopper oxidase domain-containing protein [Tenacibaculum sp. Bg11-29]